MTTTTRHTGSKFRRRVAGALALGTALLSAGALYTVFAPQPQTATAQDDSRLVVQGQQVFDNHCISCHGANLQGVADRGPSLIGVGSAATYFQVSTGRMPLARQEAEAVRKHPLAELDAKTEEGARNIDALEAFVQANGGGPTLPAERGEALRGEDPARGGQLFRLNCASCHGATGHGAPLSAGKIAPSLNQASDKQIYAAMLSGPESMPVFSDNEITPSEKRAIITYIQTLKASKDPGGNGIDRIGPVSEALVIWVGGIGAVMIAILWIGAKAR